MKRIILIFTVILCLFSTGCSVQNRDYATNIGVAKMLNESESIKVLSAKIEDGIVSAVVELNFIRLKLQDFKEIYISKSEDSAPDIKCDSEKTKQQNDDEIFNIPIKGEVILCFEDDSILLEHKLSDYLICFTQLSNDGTAETHSFLLDN